MGICLKPLQAATANIQTDITIDRNHLTGAQDSGVYIAGGSAESAVSDDLWIIANRIGACGTTPINLNNGYYGLNITVHSNETEDTETVLLTESSFIVPPYFGVHGYGRAAQPLGWGRRRVRGCAQAFTTARSALRIFDAHQTQLSVSSADFCSAAGKDRPHWRHSGYGVGTAGSKGRVGIYEDVRDGYGGYPGDLVAGSAGL